MHATQGAERHASVRETVQSLLVAFVMAMAFRGFFLEGFEIPTGSMGPTLMGRHLRINSRITDYEYPADAGPILEMASQVAAGRARDFPRPILDPMISTQQPIGAEPILQLARSSRMGDRVLVLKFLWPFTGPRRWDVVVFRNPTDPVGDSLYYIKRLVGMPGELLAFADGDVFAGPDAEHMAIQRKPDEVQRAVWQPVWDADFSPIDPERVAERMRRPLPPPPFSGDGWEVQDSRTWATSRTGQTRLEWNGASIPLDDFTAYNCFRGDIVQFPVSDLRVRASVDAGDPAALRTALAIGARGRVFTLALEPGQVRLSVRVAETGTVEEESITPCDIPSSRPFALEFWHVDQRMSVFIDGTRVATMDYDLGGPKERILASHFGRTLEQYLQNPLNQRPTPPTLAWSFEGTPVTLRGLRVDRDLYYRPTFLNPRFPDQYPTNGDFITGLGFGVDVTNPAELAAGEYVMCGDNSAASRDSRLWGRPHPLVVDQLDFDRPFRVPEDLLIGKAWSVYFPATLQPWAGAPAVIPDFGRLRFIR